MRHVLVEAVERQFDESECEMQPEYCEMSKFDVTEIDHCQVQLQPELLETSLRASMSAQ